MTYQETLDFLFTRLPMFSRIGAAAYKPDLVNTIALCRSLGEPQLSFKSIHVAGTNGKGSVSHMLAAILQSAGYKTGLYTSPHLKDFRERIKINGHMISEDYVTDFTARISHQIETIKPSFFEITVAMAFEYFKEERVDIAIIETGLGGRLDSTNIIIPEISVITNIGLDHVNLLGNTLQKIASEKAGIIKPGIPVVIGEVITETLPVFKEKTESAGAAMTIATEKRKVLNWSWQKHELIVEVAEEHQTDHKIFKLDLPGIYQTHNLLTVLETCSALVRLGWRINDTAIHNGLRYTKKLTGLHGRWEMIHHAPTIILDVAHNEDGMRMLVQQIEITTHRELHMIIGMVNDKDITAVLSLLPKHAHYYFTKAQIPRALPEQQLLENAVQCGLTGAVFAEVNEALNFAKMQAHPDDLIVVCGSVFIVGEIQ